MKRGGKGRVGVGEFGAGHRRSDLILLILTSRHGIPSQMPLRRPGVIFYDLIDITSIFYWHKADSSVIWYCVTLIVSIKKHSSPTTMGQTATSAAGE